METKFCQSDLTDSLPAGFFRSSKIGFVPKIEAKVDPFQYLESY